MDRPDDSVLLKVLHDQLSWVDGAGLQRELLSKPHSEIIVERLRIGNGYGAPPSLVVTAVPNQLRGGSYLTAVPAYAEATIHEILLTAKAPLPAIFWHGWDSTRQWYLLFSEDVALRAELGQWDRRWSEEEMSAVVRGIARFHGAGHGLVRELEDRCHWMSARPLGGIDSNWLQRLLSRVPDLTDTHRAPGALRPLERVCERYDIWKKRMRPYDTVVHCDVFMGNVALCHAANGETEALILDVEMAVVGLPHVDMEYCSQRGWQTDSHWDTLRATYRRELTASFPQFACDDVIWQWGYRLALLHLKLWWHAIALPIAEAGEGAPEEKRAFLARSGGLCNAEFLETCNLVLEEDPWS